MLITAELWHRAPCEYISKHSLSIHNCLQCDWMPAKILCMVLLWPCRTPAHTATQLWGRPPNRCETVLHSESVASFHSTLATLFYRDMHRQKLVFFLSITGRNLWQSYRNVSFDILKFCNHWPSMKAGSTTSHHSVTLLWTQTDGELHGFGRVGGSETWK